MMRRWPGPVLLALAGLLAAMPAAATVRALFVGINTYPGGVLARPLKGAVGDVAMIKRALAETRGLALDPLMLTVPEDGPECHAKNAVSTTLINRCATRDAILQALKEVIAGAAPGDHVLFYYAGHGALTATRGADTQAGDSSMLVAVDSMGPKGKGGILDIELREELATALARGVSVVTIFDACNSGTATRDVRPGNATRGVGVLKQPAAAARAEQRLASLPPPRDGAYLVHMAAAGDDALAVELQFPDDRGGTSTHGVFSRALDVALRNGAERSYRAIMADVRSLMSQLGSVDQVPVAADRPLAKTRWPRIAINEATRRDLAVQRAMSEGPLDLGFLGSPPGRRVLPVTMAADGTTATLQQGQLANVTLGSSYSLYRSSTPGPQDAAAATAVVVRVTPTEAVLQPVPALPGQEIGSAVEMAHADAPARVRVALVNPQGRCEALGARIEQALTDVPAVVRDDLTPTLRIVMPRDCAGPVEVQTAQQALVTQIGSGPLLPRRLAEVTRAAARVNSLLALANNAFDEFVEDMAFTGCSEPPCDPMQGGDVVKGRVGDGFGIALTARRRFHAYAFLIDDRNFRVTPLGVPDNAEDTLWLPLGEQAGGFDGKERVLFDGKFSAAGRGKLLLLLSPQPLRAEAWRQEAVRSADTIGWTALEQALASAGSGTRSAAGANGAAASRAADWAGRVIHFEVTAATAAQGRRR